MTAAVLQARQGLFLTTSALLAIVLLFLVIALGVSVGELSIPLSNVFYAIGNKLGLTAVPLNRIYERDLGLPPEPRAGGGLLRRGAGNLRRGFAEPAEKRAG